MADYDSLISGLKSSQVRSYAPDPVLTEKVNDAAAFGKSFLGGTGAMLEGDAIKKTFKSLSKKGSEGLLKQLDLSSDDMEELASKLETGDAEGISQFIAKRGISVARNKIGGFVRSSKGQAKEFLQSMKSKFTGGGEEASAPEDAAGAADSSGGLFDSIPTTTRGGQLFDLGEDAAQEFTTGIPERFGSSSVYYDDPPDADGGSQAGSNPETDVKDPASVTDDAMKANGSQRQQQASNPDKSSEENNLQKTGEMDGDAEAEASQIGSKVEKGLDELTVDSEAFDETPVGIAVTAGLGLVSLISGIMIKTHKDAFTTPPMPTIRQSSFAVQKGTF
tara:strand:+ start:666 stop:1667 length:1002 start_codon:yes stop_codon:yes gene_type:complete